MVTSPSSLHESWRLACTQIWEPLVEWHHPPAFGCNRARRVPGFRRSVRSLRPHPPVGSGVAIDHCQILPYDLVNSFQLSSTLALLFPLSFFFVNPDFITVVMLPPLTAPAACYSTDFNIRKACRQACTLTTCPMNLSYWAYLPSLPANGIFTALFSLSLALYLLQAVYSRRFLAFSVAMLCGSVLEVIGYIGRLMSHSNPFSQVRSAPCHTHICIHLGFHTRVIVPQYLRV
jgi:hypothetical protein